MKTTIEISTSLLERSKALARRENTTLKALIEESLRATLNARSRRRKTRFGIQAFAGTGLTPEFKDASWEVLRNEIYHGRG